MGDCVNDCMQKGYRYKLTDPVGRNFDPEFKPELTPAEMLALGGVSVAREHHPLPQGVSCELVQEAEAGAETYCSLNYFGVDASRPLSEWRFKGWLHHDDPRGWFQWYCRYYMGRRMPAEDKRQIKR